MSSATFEVGPHFPPDTKVEVHPRVTDFALAVNGKPVATAKADDAGEVKVSGLVPFGQYWLVADVDGTQRSVAITAPGGLSAPEGSPEALAEETRKRAEAAAKIRSDHAHLSPAPHSTTQVPVPESWGPHPSNFEKSDEAEPQPHVKQADVPKGTPQRSDTPLGQATPVDPDEFQPRVPQEAVKPGTPQRSDTETGEATPVDPREVEPNPKQEDVPKRTKQRSDTQTGQAEPVPKGSKVEIEKAKDDSLQKAKGATVPKAGTDKSPGKEPAKVASPVKPAARKAARKAQETNDPAPTPADVKARRGK